MIPLLSSDRNLSAIVLEDVKSRLPDFALPERIPSHLFAYVRAMQEEVTLYQEPSTSSDDEREGEQERLSKSPTPTEQHTGPSHQSPVYQSPDYGIRINLVKAGAFEIIFGPSDWKQYFGNVGEAPSIDSSTMEKFHGNCPIWKQFWNSKKMNETHALIFMPKTVDGKPYSIEYLQQAMSSSKGEKHVRAYPASFNKKILPYRQDPTPSSGWMLISLEVCSEGKKYEAQQKAASKLGYSVSRALEVATVISVVYAKWQREIYLGKHIRCQNRYQYSQLVVSDSSTHGFEIGIDDASKKYSVAAVQRIGTYC